MMITMEVMFSEHREKIYVIATANLVWWTANDYLFSPARSLHDTPSKTRISFYDFSLQPLGGAHTVLLFVFLSLTNLPIFLICMPLWRRSTAAHSDVHESPAASAHACTHRSCDAPRWIVKEIARRTHLRNANIWTHFSFGFNLLFAYRIWTYQSPTGELIRWLGFCELKILILCYYISWWH